MKFPSEITVVDVAARDGIQSFRNAVDTDTKVAIVNRLNETGLPVIEVTGFAHPRVIPNLADAEDVCERITYRPGVTYRGLVPNVRGAERGIKTKVGKMPMMAVGKAIIDGDTSGFVKVIADAETDEVLGVHMIGHHVTELIAESSTAMLLEATAWEVGSAVHPHPTLSEAMGEAAMAVDGKSINF